MSANKHVPHVLVLPEDDANNQILNGFELQGALDTRVFQPLPCAGGWAKVRDEFQSVHINAMRRNANRYMVLLVDFDEKTDRFDKMTEVIPSDLKDRVFVVGVWSEPEDMKRAGLGSNEDVGLQLANECCDETRNVWNHDLLQHNADELGRMTTLLKPILFPSL